MLYKFRDTTPINTDPVTVTGEIVTVDTSDEITDLVGVTASLEPIQDLHGYDKPWSGGAGKNKLTDSVTGATVNGITFTVNSDGTVTANGTATAQAVRNFYNAVTPASVGLANGTYILNGCPSGGGSGTYGIRMAVTKSSGTTNYSDYGNGATFTIDSDVTAVRVYVFVALGATVSNLKFYPMIRLSSVSDATYEPYSNICPISGHTECVTSVSGVNVWDEEWEAGSLDAQGQPVANRRRLRSKNYIPIMPNTQYYGCFDGVYTTGTWYSICYYDADKSYVSSYAPNKNAVFTTPNNAKYMKFNTSDSWGGATYTKGISINYPSTDHEYHAYNGNTYTTSLGRTVYGGSLDVVSGVLTVTRAYVGGSDWTYFRSNNGFKAYKIENAPLAIDASATIQGAMSNAIGTFGTFSSTAMTQNIIQPPSTAHNITYMALDENVDASTVFLCYLVKEPQTIQLTPTEVELLLGQNNLWTDCGEISVTTKKTIDRVWLPSEAVSINGQYLEHQISGYRTLYTKGRETLGAEVNTYKVGTANGERLKSTAYPARKLTVGFQLVAENNEEFRSKFTELNHILALEQADFVFYDEADKYFTGTPIMDGEIPAGENSVKGEWHIYCAYPFKRSVDVKHLTMANAVVSGNTATFGIDYLGDQPAKPILRAKFAPTGGASYSEDGDCGFVAFVDKNSNIIQLGNPSVIAYDDDDATIALVNQNYINLDGWNVTGGSGVPSITGTMKTANITDAMYDFGTGQTMPYAQADSYGTGTAEHGSVLWKNLSQSATDFDLKMVHKFCCQEATEAGSFYCLLQDESNNTVAGIKFSQQGNSTRTDVQFFAKGNNVTDVEKHMTIEGDMGGNYGYAQKNLSKTKPRIINGKVVRPATTQYIYTQYSNLTQITKKGGIVRFAISGREIWELKTDDRTPISKITLFFGAYGSQPMLNTNAVASMVLMDVIADKFADVPNVFLAGDVVEADCNSASVTMYRNGTLNGYNAPQYGALGNSWESFELTKGINAIQVIWSDWVDPNYKPEIEIDYNEVFI